MSGGISSSGGGSDMRWWVGQRRPEALTVLNHLFDF